MTLHKLPMRSLRTIQGLHPRIFSAFRVSLSCSAYSLTAGAPENEASLLQKPPKAVARVSKAGRLRDGLTISTLKLEKGIESGQWLRLKPGIQMRRRVIFDGKVLGRSSLKIPKAPFETSEHTHEVLCPYFEPKSQTLRFWAQDRGDIGLQFSARRFGTQGLRAIRELAIAEGLLKALPEHSVTINDAGLKYRYELAQKDGYSGSFREWAGGVRNQQVVFIKTLVREKVLATKQQISFNFQHNRFSALRTVLVDKSREGRAEITLPLSAFPEGTIRPTACVYFDEPTQCLRFCTLDGNDIPGASAYPTSYLAGPSKRWLLVLAQAEGLLDKIPAARLETFDFQVGIASGFYMNYRLSPRRKGATSSNTLRFADGTSQDHFAVRFPMGVEYLKGLPYIDEMEQLRVWDKDRQRDAELFLGVISLDGPTVRRRYPRLFAYAQSLGYWKTL